MFRLGSGSHTEVAYRSFRDRYLQTYVISDGVINRLTRERTIFDISNVGDLSFRYPYVYYFFLGRFFALNQKQHIQTIGTLAETSYLTENAHILIFAIHHASDDELVETVLIHTMVALTGPEACNIGASGNEIVRVGSRSDT